MPHIKPLTQQPFARMTRDRILHPERLTLEDLDKLRRYGHVPLEEIKEALVR